MRIKNFFGLIILCMKKFCALFAVFLFLFLVFAEHGEQDRFFEYFCKIDGVQFCYVSTDKNDEMNSGSKVVASGRLFLNYFSSSVARLKNVEYRQAQFAGGDAAIQQICADLHINCVLNEFVEGRRVLIGYSPIFAQKIFVGGRMVNFEIVENDGILTVGCPFVYGAF